MFLFLFLLALATLTVAEEGEACDTTDTTDTESNTNGRRGISETHAEMNREISPGQFRHVPKPEIPQTQFWYLLFGSFNYTIYALFFMLKLKGNIYKRS